MSGAPLPVVDLYLDFLSPFSYLAAHRLRKLTTEGRATIRYRAIDLAAAKRAIGNTGPTNRDMPIKLRYLAQDLGQWAQRYGIPLRFIKNYNSERLNVGCGLAETRGCQAEYVEHAYNLTWAVGDAPDDPAVLNALCQRLGWDSDEFSAYVTSDEGKAAYQRCTSEAIERHVFGVPTMLLDGEMWWGNDRLFLLEERLNERTEARPAVAIN